MLSVVCVLRREVMSSYFQTHGYKKTAFLDSDTMELLVDNEGMAEVLEVFKVCEPACMQMTEDRSP